MRYDAALPGRIAVETAGKQHLRKVTTSESFGGCCPCLWRVVKVLMVRGGQFQFCVGGNPGGGPGAARPNEVRGERRRKVRSFPEGGAHQLIPPNHPQFEIMNQFVIGFGIANQFLAIMWVSLVKQSF